MTIRFTILLAALALACACSREIPVAEPKEQPVTWAASLEEAQMETRRTGDRILASFEAYWCPWSRLLRDSLYVNPVVAESLASFKCVALDADRDSALCKAYDIRVFPTILIMDCRGVELERLVGYSPPAEFLQRLSTLRQSDEVVAEMFAREQRSGDDPEFLLAFGDLLRDMGTYGTALMRYEKAVQLTEGKRADLYEEATYAMAECSMLAGEYRAAAERFRSFIESNPRSDRRGDAAILGALCYQRSGDHKRADGMLETYLRTDPDGPFAESVRKQLNRIGETRGRGN
jgi:tetratricopeptide (TPR) repeat protein